MTKQYAKRDIMELDHQGNHYCRHMSAMTGEDLHSKSDIAAELAYRDARITELETELVNAENCLEFANACKDSLKAQVVGFKGEYEVALDRVEELEGKLEMQQEAYQSINKELNNTLKSNMLERALVLFEAAYVIRSQLLNGNKAFVHLTQEAEKLVQMAGE